MNTRPDPDSPAPGLDLATPVPESRAGTRDHADDLGRRDSSGEGAESALALLKRRQQARRLIQPPRELG